MSELLKSNCTGRMKSYMEAGCSIQCRNISNINQCELLQFSNETSFVFLYVDGLYGLCM
nr:unnamed protein product [Digitaria exilis]